MTKGESSRLKEANLTKQTLRIFWDHACPYWPTILLCLLAMVVVVGCDVFLPIIYKRFFDQLALDPIHRTDRASLDEIYHTVFLVGIVLSISWIGWRVSMFMISWFESRIMKDLTDYCFKYLHNHSHRFFTDTFAGALVKRVNRFAAGFEVVADQCVMELGQTLLRIVLVISVLFTLNTTLGFVFLGWTVVFTGFSLLYSRWKLKYDLARAELDTSVSARIADTVTNSVNLKLFAAIDREVSSFRELTDRHQRSRLLAWRLGWLSDTIQGASTRILEIVILLIAIYYWRAGMLTIGDFVLLRSYLSKLNEEVRQIGQYVRRIYESVADANEMTEILVRLHEVVDDEKAATLSPSGGEVEFRNVQFSYANRGKMVLKDFTLKTKPGERVGIVGPSGGGKSTILRILTRLYDVAGGAILIDHQDIARVTQESLHRNIAFVPQDPILFHRSLMENIRYSRPSATDEEVLEAAHLAHCHEFITSFPEGYDTLVGERGVKLSGGERQRVAIARAILMNAPILVLDEATSSLDSESESLIQDSLSKLMKGRTVIAVAHRLSTIQKMDRIIVVEDGHITEEGGHAVLMKIQNGTYRKLWELQAASEPMEKPKPGEYVQ